MFHGMTIIQTNESFSHTLNTRGIYGSIKYGPI